MRWGSTGNVLAVNAVFPVCTLAPSSPVWCSSMHPSSILQRWPCLRHLNLNRRSVTYLFSAVPVGNGSRGCYSSTQPVCPSLNWKRVFGPRIPEDVSANLPSPYMWLYSGRALLFVPLIDHQLLYSIEECTRSHEPSVHTAGYPQTGAFSDGSYRITVGVITLLGALAAGAIVHCCFHALHTRRVVCPSPSSRRVHAWC